MLSVEQRFWRFVSPEPMSGCYLWMGADNQVGYGQMTINGRRVLAHRLSYEMYKGPIPDGLELDHKCRVRCCVNPDHLEPVTRRENVMRGQSPTRFNAEKTHCKRGHEFTIENTKIEPPNHRSCRTCIRERRRRRAAH